MFERTVREKAIVCKATLDCDNEGKVTSAFAKRSSMILQFEESFNHRSKISASELSKYDGPVETQETNLQSHWALFATQIHASKETNNASYA